MRNYSEETEKHCQSKQLKMVVGGGGEGMRQWGQGADLVKKNISYLTQLIQKLFVDQMKG